MVRPLNRIRGGENRKSLLQSPPDLIFAVLAILLTAIGTVMLYSAGSGTGDPFAFLKSHLIHLAIAGGTCLIFLFVTTPTSARWMAPVLYAVSVVLLVLVKVLGVAHHQAQRWLDFGIVTFQPSELAKTAIILLFAVYFTVNPERFQIHWGALHLIQKILHPKKCRVEHKKFWKSFLLAFVFAILIPGMILVIPVGLTMWEPHFSGGIIMGAIGAVMMLLGGTSLLQVLLVGAPAGCILWKLLTGNSYANQRIQGFLNRGGNGAADEQTTHGLWAMGSGGWFGCGLGNSVMKYGYVPEPQNDFIFSIICEELGFCGAMLIILLFLALFSRGIRLAQKCEDRFSSLVIVGISFKIILHAFLNMGVAMAILPNTGISLPFFSSGGSAAIVQGMDIGILLGLSRFCKYD